MDKKRKYDYMCKRNLPPWFSSCLARYELSWAGREIGRNVLQPYSGGGYRLSGQDGGETEGKRKCHVARSTSVCTLCGRDSRGERVCGLEGCFWGCHFVTSLSLYIYIIYMYTPYIHYIYTILIIIIIYIYIYRCQSDNSREIGF